MLLDALTIPLDSMLEALVCVIGAGPAGITIARELSARGIEVLLIESGAERHTNAAGDFLRDSSIGYPSHTDRTRQRGFGGTSNHWTSSGLRVRPLDPIDFEQRQEVPNSGWPFGYAEPEPFYRRAQESLELGPYVYDGAAWEDVEKAPRLPLPGPDVRTEMFQFASRDHFMRLYDEVASTPSIRLLLHSTVAELVATPEGTALDHLSVVARDGRRFSVRAKAYVLACGGIENARLLLASRSSRSEGLGNEQDLVGRYYMEHISTDSAFFWPSDPRLVERLRLYGEHWIVGDAKLQGFLALSPEALRRERLQNAAFWVMPSRREWATSGVRSLRALGSGVRRRPWGGHVGGHALNILKDGDDVARWLYRYPRRDYRGLEVVRLRFMAEQSPNYASRVTLDDRKRDRIGLPRVQLDWRLTEADLDSVRRSEAVIARALLAAGVGELRGMFGSESPPALVVGNAHHMGTTRMHQDPKRGVVDANSRMHAMPNLFVAGSSVFPTGGFANPTLTIVALALRLSDHLQNQLAGDRRKSRSPRARDTGLRAPAPSS